MIQSVVVLGAGSAGLMAALSFKKHFPRLSVKVVRDPKIGVIGVGESTTPNVPVFLFQFLGISPKHFYAIANPTWKIGIHFRWGTRPFFQYGFRQQLDAQWRDLPMPNGYYCDEDFSYGDMTSALMHYKKAFRRGSSGAPDIQEDHAFHIYNPDYVKALEMVGKEWGIEYIDGTMEKAERGPEGIAAIHLQDGRRIAGDLFIDASGFKAELIGKVLNEPFKSFASSLYCDRAVVGSWERTNEPVLPYTTVDTMDAGWCWQIEHEKQINRGYVFSSADMSDDQAREEFLRKNPKATTWDHTVKFRSGRVERGWVENVIALGNSGGFVEPLEATALMLLCANCQSLVSILQNCMLTPTPTVRKLFNDLFASGWDDIRNFLSLHYRFNHRLDTQFWKRCRAEVDVSGMADFIEFYQENGPTPMARHVIGNKGLKMGLHNAFGIEGHLVIMQGMSVPYKKTYVPTDEEWRRWKQHKADLGAEASRGLTVEEALMYIRHPGWKWNVDIMKEKGQQPAPMQAG